MGTKARVAGVTADEEQVRGENNLLELLLSAEDADGRVMKKEEKENQRC